MSQSLLHQKSSSERTSAPTTPILNALAGDRARTAERIGNALPPMLERGSISPRILTQIATDPDHVFEKSNKFNKDYFDLDYLEIKNYLKNNDSNSNSNKQKVITLNKEILKLESIVTEASNDIVHLKKLMKDIPIAKNDFREQIIKKNSLIDDSKQRVKLIRETISYISSTS